MDIGKIVQEIQYVLAPAVMVSSSALLLLGFQNKFSSLANRFRTLNHEKRLLAQKSVRDPTEANRFESLVKQIDQLMCRAGYVKNAILLSYVGIVCFTGTSVLIFLNVYTSFQIFNWITALFLLGLLCVLLSSVLMIFETSLFYQIISIERKS